MSLNLRILPRDGYTPKIADLLAMLEYTRETTLKAVQGLSRAQLDFHHGIRGNSIGALLAHIAALEAAYQVRTFEGREPNDAEKARWLPAWLLGERARQAYHDHDLAFYVDLLCEVRKHTCEQLSRRDDHWLLQEFDFPNGKLVNYHWAWFHVFEDELSHRGQILLIRNHLLPKGATASA
ncbi:DinB family protein [Deinococcus peraridilitoris]|uniref:DUF664 domain-containing protein n=1 Tax=Deinococcus peraridilitoris (strain DSM 19664 / LMG 22246 / CIP 109416 / KR-200) TaxID=937777 RepID=L0A2L1_DEIPD|nr:DinB family protein [Deinococcus peraridilitoris]AFZ67250.1 Protein of unknown function (DUF664) [Deinococcus peraridilitoris DSM 19664]